MSLERRERLPRHIAFIMDGNGRWARRRGMLRLQGHERGAESLRRITRHCRRIGIEEVTFYALSAENYARRPGREVRYLMELLRRFLIDERPELTENGIRLVAIGDTAKLPAEVQAELAETIRLTERFDGMTLRLALNYGSRQEVVEAVRSLAREAAAGRLDPEAIDESLVRQFLHDPEMADPDLVVRTAGEHRLSNFLLWQCSYSELWFSDRLWPEFDVSDLELALEAYAVRERRFGAVGSSADRPPQAVEAEK